MKINDLINGRKKNGPVGWMNAQPLLLYITIKLTVQMTNAIKVSDI
jgi:hypothetical protein